MREDEERINPFESKRWKVNAGATLAIVWMLLFGTRKAEAMMRASLVAQRRDTHER